MAASPLSFVDTNVFLRVLTRDDDEKAAAALALLQRVERGDERVVTSPLVIFETVFTLQKSYGVARDRVRALMLPILQLRSLELLDKTIHIEALDLFATANVSYADAYNATYMRRRHVFTVYSWDEDFDRLTGIERREPRSAEESGR